jgi:phage terminase large subunit
VTAIQVALVPKLIEVFAGPADVRGAYGGRGSGKTRSFAKMVAVRGFMFGSMGLTGQLVCGRQFMNSLEDSSLEECKRAIEEEPFLAAYYEIGDKYIKSRDGRIWFTFVGLDRNIASIKSKGRILLLWVDEAEPVTDAAWNVVQPTLREEGDDWNAELWVTWNPRRKTAAVEHRFRFSKDPRVKIVECNWRDNPRFPAVLERQRLRDLEQRPEEYDHIWEGKYGFSQGAILARWMNKAERDGRVSDNVVFDPNGAPIEISSDLGFRDTASWWFWQRKFGGYSLLKYMGASGWDAEDWIGELKKIIADEFGGRLGKIWLPHDAKAKTFQSKHSSIEKFVEAFTAAKVAIVPQTKKEHQINAARTVVDRCEFNKTACDQGIDGLLAWEFSYNEDTQAFSKEPLHNWASHPADAFAYGCQVMEEQKAPEANEPPRWPVKGNADGTITVAPLEELWKSAPRPSGRI